MREKQKKEQAQITSFVKVAMPGTVGQSRKQRAGKMARAAPEKVKHRRHGQGASPPPPVPAPVPASDALCSLVPLGATRSSPVPGWQVGGLAERQFRRLVAAVGGSCGQGRRLPCHVRRSGGLWACACVACEPLCLLRCGRQRCTRGRRGGVGRHCSADARQRVVTQARTAR